METGQTFKKILVCVLWFLTTAIVGFVGLGIVLGATLATWPIVPAVFAALVGYGMGVAGGIRPDRRNISALFVFVVTFFALVYLKGAGR